MCTLSSAVWNTFGYCAPLKGIREPLKWSSSLTHSPAIDARACFCSSPTFTPHKARDPVRRERMWSWTRAIEGKARGARKLC